ncbi:MAG: type VI secretion system accessory protein TagJ [Bryobacteraceae bacterium]
MNATELYKAGRLTEAVQALGAELRENPADAKRRTFLFELLSFAGEYDRALKQLDVLAQEGPQAEMGTLVYRGAIQAERQRQELFRSKAFPEPAADAAEANAGTINGTAFEFIEDADPRIGARLEVFAAGTYVWVPLAHVLSIEISPPQQLRDLLWTPAVVRLGPGMKGKDLGHVLLPVLAPFSYQHPDEAVRLGRQTVWMDEEGEPIPYGQKAFLVDGEEFPLLEVREIRFGGA